MMGRQSNRSPHDHLQRIIFVYNADGGFFNALADRARKTLLPGTCRCNLCAVTHTPLGMRYRWKRFIQSLEIPVQFLHRDELAMEHGLRNMALPAVFLERHGMILPWIAAPEIHACPSVDALLDLVRRALAACESQDVPTTSSKTPAAR